MKKIKLIGEKNRGKFAFVDDDDFLTINRYSWNVDGNGYVYTAMNGKSVFLHRLLLGAKERKVFVDHINGDILDNRRCNLRKCTHAQNMMNRKMSKNNLSGRKGVHIEYVEGKKGIKKWYRTQISANNKKYDVGKFKTLNEASFAYDIACKILHGKFARPNT